MSPLLRRIGAELPIVQAPMAGVSTPVMAAAVSNAGGLGSIGVGAVDADGTRRMIAAVRAVRKQSPKKVIVAVPLNVGAAGAGAPALQAANTRLANTASDKIRYSFCFIFLLQRELN